MKLREISEFANLIASVAVIASLIVLIMEVRTNTDAVDRQSRMDQLNMLNEPYLDDVDLGEVLSKVKAVDGREPSVTAFMEAYNLTEIEASVWLRHLYSVWGALEADFVYRGPEFVESKVRALIPFKDGQIYWDSGGGLHSPEFTAYVEGIRKELGAAE